MLTTIIACVRLVIMISHTTIAGPPPHSILQQFFSRAGMRQQDVARAMRYHKGHVSRLLRGERVITEAFLWRFQETFVDSRSPFYLPDAANVLANLRIVTHTALAEAPL